MLACETRWRRSGTSTLISHDFPVERYGFSTVPRRPGRAGSAVMKPVPASVRTWYRTVAGRSPRRCASSPFVSGPS